MQAFKRAEGLKRHELKEMFTDVYGGEEPWNIVRSYTFVPRVTIDRFLLAEGTKTGTCRVAQEVRADVGAVAVGIKKVQGQWRRTHTRPWKDRMNSLSIL